MGYADLDDATISQFTPAFTRAGELLFGKDNKVTLTENTSCPKTINKFKEIIRTLPRNVGNYAFSNLQKQLKASNNDKAMSSYIQPLTVKLDDTNTSNEEIVGFVREWLGVDIDTTAWKPFQTQLNDERQLKNREY